MKTLLWSLAFGAAHAALFVGWVFASDFAFAIAWALSEATGLHPVVLGAILTATTIWTTHGALRGLASDGRPARAMLRGAAWGAANGLLVLLVAYFAALAREGGSNASVVALGVPVAAVVGAFAGTVFAGVDLLVLRALGVVPNASELAGKAK